MSSPLQLYHQFHTSLKEFSKWGRPELVSTLAHMMVGIFMCSDVRLSRIAESVPLDIQEDSVAQRFRRWLKNPAVDEQVIYDPVVKRLLYALRSTRLRIQIDRTMIDDRFNVLILSLYYRKRAIPLVWQVISTGKGNSNQSHWQAIFAHLAELLPPNVEIMILGDREFGQPDMITLLRQYNWDYCLRLKRNYWVYSLKWGLWLRLSELTLEPGQSRFFTNVWLTKSKQVGGLHLALALDENSDDPWIIATSQTPSARTLREYARRFACEELFSDMKARGFHLETSQLQHAERFSKLVLVVALLIVWMITLARQVRIQRLDRQLTYRYAQGRYSLFQIGRRWLKKQLTLGRDTVPCPDFCPWTIIQLK